MSNTHKTKKMCKSKRLTGYATFSDKPLSSERIYGIASRYGNQRHDIAKQKVRARRLRRKKDEKETKKQINEALECSI